MPVYDLAALSISSLERQTLVGELGVGLIERHAVKIERRVGFNCGEAGKVRDPC